MRRELVQERANAVDEARMVTREELERDQRRPSARWALILEAAPEELGLLSEAELADRAVGDRPFLVVGRARGALDLVLPARPEPGELLLSSLFGEGVRLGRR